MRSIYARVREDLEKNGWCQGDYYQPTQYRDRPPACILGSFRRQLLPLIDELVFARAVCEAIRVLYPEWRAAYPYQGATAHSVIVAFNDEDGRTVEDMILVLKHAEEEQA